MKKILCVEDGKDTQLILKACLNGYSVHFAPSLGLAKAAIKRESFDFVIIDISLPDGSGLDFFADHSEILESSPVFFLSGSSSLAAKASAFSLGADDFVMKPFDPKEFRLRLDARLKKSSMSKKVQGTICVGTLICNLTEQRAYDSGSDGESYNLTMLEFKILVLLARTPNRVFSRAEIIDRVWSDASTTERAVDVHISHIRKKIAPSKIDIAPVVGAGYRLTLTSK
jgi:DNA-binding response OmpR family regulator